MQNARAVLPVQIIIVNKKNDNECKKVTKAESIKDRCVRVYNNGMKSVSNDTARGGFNVGQELVKRGNAKEMPSHLQFMINMN